MSELGNEPDSKQKAVLERHASWIELFFDLVVVAGIGQLAHLLHGSPSWSDVALYALLYLAFWTAWATFTMYGNVAGDRVRIPSMLIAMFGLAVMMAAVAGIHDNHALAFAVAYVAVRLLASRVWHNGQIVVDWPIAQMSLGVIPWIVSFWFEGETRFWLWTAGVTIDLLIMFVVSGSAIMEDAQEKLDRIIKVRGFKDDRIPELEALHSDRAHLAERLGLYVIIVLGEGVILVISAASKLTWDSTVVSLAVGSFVLLSGMWLSRFSTATPVFRTCRPRSFPLASTWRCTVSPPALSRFWSQGSERQPNTVRSTRPRTCGGCCAEASQSISESAWWQGCSRDRTDGGCSAGRSRAPPSPSSWASSART